MHCVIKRLEQGVGDEEEENEEEKKYWSLNCWGVLHRFGDWFEPEQWFPSSNMREQMVYSSMYGCYLLLVCP